MAAKQITRAAARAAALDAFNLPEDAPDMIDADSARAALREKLGIETDVESTIHVYLIEGEPKQDHKIWQGEANDYNLESLAKSFGSGLYRIKAYARNEVGYKPLVFNFTQAWKLSPEDEAKVIQRREAAKNPTPAPAHNGHDQGELMRTMLAGFEQIAARMTPAPAQVDPFTLFEKIATAMRAMQPAAPAPGADLASMLGMLKTLKEITGDGGDNMSATERLLLKAGEQFIPALAQGLTKQQAQPQAQPAQAQIAAPAGAQITEEQKHMNLVQELKVASFQAMLIVANKAAARGVAPADYAGTIYDAFDDDDIEGLALQPDWWQVICAAQPDCAKWESFYLGVRAAIIEMGIEDGILERGADGKLTIPDEKSKTEESQAGAGANGPSGTRKDTTP